jgi:hypothetical protein
MVYGLLKEGVQGGWMILGTCVGLRINGDKIYSGKRDEGYLILK